MIADEVYSVEIDAPADDAPCRCGGCSWRGRYADLAPIKGCSLTPGHPSPAGRCPDEDCGALCYPDTPEARLADAAPAMLAALRAAYAEFGRDFSGPVIDAMRQAIADATGVDPDDLIAEAEAQRCAD